MEKEEFIRRYLLPTDSSEELPKLSRIDLRRFGRTVEDIGLRAVFGAIINEAGMRQRIGRLSAVALTRVLDVHQRFLEDPAVLAGPYVVQKQGRLGSRFYQMPGIVLYDVKDGSERS